ncbi:MAG: hypothetical protein O2955_10160 [Planctomycetota bacterium]|nr:hypothetical protein [Planctomycetota bacterium]MDA1212874.1 hypothetical protein [Planctomycetota bacterium]
MNRLRTIGVLVGVWSVCIWSLGSHSMVPAQDSAVPSVQDSAQSPSSLNLIAQNDDSDAAPATDAAVKEKGDFWERLIYVPFKNLQMVFNKQGASVLIPYMEYLQLWDASQNMRAKPADVPAVITEAHYVATIDQDVARVTADLSVQVLGEGWTEVPVGFGQAAVGKMTPSDENVLIRGIGNGNYGLLFPKAGKYSVTLELLAKVQTSPDGRQFNMQTPSVAITTMEVVVPEADQTIDVTPQQIVQPVESAEGETRVKATLGATQNISVTWHPRASTKPEMELLSSVTNHTRIMYDDGLIRTDAYLSYEVLRGEMQQIRLAVPVADRILDITSPDAKVKGWQAAVEENRQVITVEFLSAIQKGVTVEIHTERSAPTDSAVISGINEEGVVSGIHAMDSVRESGQLVVGNSSTITLAIDDQSGLIRVAPEEIAENIRTANALYFKFYSPQYTLKVTARPVQPHVTVNHHTRLEFDDDEIRIRSDFLYAIEQAGIFDVKLKVPEEVEIERVDGPDVKEHTFDESSRTLTVVFNAKKEENATFTVTSKLPIEQEEMTEDEMPEEEAADDEADAATPEVSDDAQLLLPILEPLNVAREEGTVEVFAPDSMEIITDEKKLIAAQPNPAVNAQAIPGYRLASAWIYHRRPVEIWVKTTRKPTRLLVDLGTTLNVKEELIEVSHRLTYIIQYAGIDTFVFSVPAALVDKIQIRSLGDSSIPAIKQQSKANTAVDGWVNWTVVLQRDYVGSVPLEITYDINAKTKQGEPASLTYAPIRVQDSPAKEGKSKRVAVSRIAGEIAVLKDRALSVSAKASTATLEPIDIRELRLLPTEGSLAFRYYVQPVELKLDVVKHEIQEVVQTVVSRELVEIVASKDDRLAHRVRLLLKTSERQRLRIDLPAGVEPLSILVDRKPVTLEKNDAGPQQEGWTSFFLNVSRTKSSDEPFTVTLQYLLPATPQPFDSWGGELTVPLPRIGGAEAAGVAVQQLKTVIWVPDEFSIVSTPDHFTSDNGTRVGIPWFGQLISQSTTDELTNWIGEDDGSLFDFPTAGHAFRYGNLGGTDAITLTWWNMSTYSWIISGATVLIGWILRKASWESKIGLLLMVSLVAALYALKDVHLVEHVYAAMRYGLFTVLAMWIIHSLLGIRRRVFVEIEPTSPAASDSVSVASATVSGKQSEGQLPPAVIPPPGTFDNDDSQSSS